MDNERVTKLTFVKRFNYDLGNNILLNRMHALNGASLNGASLNGKIDKSWLNLDSFKVKYKELFLK